MAHWGGSYLKSPQIKIATKPERHLVLSVDLLLERLRGMQEALVVYANGAAQRVLTQRSPEQEELFVALNLRPLAEQVGNTVLDL